MPVVYESQDEQNQASPEEIVVFDVDHTLCNVCTPISYGQFLRRKGKVSTAALLKASACYFYHKFNSLPMHMLHTKMLGHIEKMNLPYKELEKEAQLFWNQPCGDSCIDPYVLSLLRLHQENGSITAIATSSPRFLIEPLAKKLNIDYVLASEYTEGERGEVKAPRVIVSGLEKANFALSLAKKHKLEQNAIVAYSDSIVDYPLLAVAKRAVAVNPGRHLWQLASLFHWRILETKARSVA